MLKHRDCVDIGLAAGEKTCPHCGRAHLRWYPRRDHPENPTAQQCKACGTLIWMNGRSGLLRKLWADYHGDDKKNAGSPGEWWDQVMKEFHERFPPCPCCGGTDFSIFSPVKSYPREISCASCGGRFEWAGAEEVTVQH